MKAELELDLAEIVDLPVDASALDHTTDQALDHTLDQAPWPHSAATAVPVKLLRASDSPRLAGVDEQHVRVLAELEEELPPIVVHRETMRVIDGMHRLRAAQLRGRSTIAVTFFDGSPRESFVLAVEANIRHGLPLTLADRREAARRILQAFPEWSNRAIAAKTGLSGKTVGKLRGADEQLGGARLFRIGRDGRARPLDPAAGRERATQALLKRPDASLREIARSVGVSIGTVRDVRDRLRHGRSPLPRPRGSARDGAPEALRTPPRRATDPAPILAALRRDPALRYSDTGRQMIRWLEARIVRAEELELLMEAPPHQASRIAALARACAAHWDMIAEEIERREDGAPA